MFHKGKRRRRLIDPTQALPDASLVSGPSELERISSSFEPTRYEVGEISTPPAPNREEPETHSLRAVPSRACVRSGNLRTAKESSTLGVTRRMHDPISNGTMCRLRHLTTKIRKV